MLDRLLTFYISSLKNKPYVGNEIGLVALATKANLGNAIRDRFIRKKNLHITDVKAGFVGCESESVKLKLKLTF